MRSLWISPSIPLVFHFYGGKAPQVNRRWIEELMNEASAPHGLTVVPEPSADTAPTN